MEKNRKAPMIIALRIIIAILTAVYSLTMVCMAGAGLIYNGESYGRELVNVGIWLIVSGILMTAGAVLCFMKKRIFAVLSIVLTIVGLVLCLVMVYIICSHADSAGWADNFTMEPVSRMYRARLLPVIVPAVMVIAADICKLRIMN